MPDPGTISSEPLMASLQALPMGVHVVLGAGLAAGMVLWLAGSRVAQPMFALFGVVLGSSLGFFLAPLLAIEPVNDIPTPYLGLGVGALLGLAVSVALFRFTMAIGAAVVLALACMMGTSVYLDHAQPTSQEEAAPQAESAPPPSDEITSTPVPFSSANPTEWARQAAERTRAFLDNAAAAGKRRWDQVPGEHRLMVAGGGAGGALFGFLFGVFVPKRASALVTALFGSAMWLACAAWVAHATAAPGLAILDQPKQVWLVIWPATAAVGMLVQWMLLVRSRKTEG